jgi:DNA-binding response OmpR family regulator
MRVLLIEDDNTVASALELMLSAEGFNVYSTDLAQSARSCDFGQVEERTLNA